MIVAQLVVAGALLSGQGDGRFSGQDAIVDLHACSLERFQPGDALHACCGEERRDVAGYLAVVVEPFQAGVSLRIDAFVADDGDPAFGGYVEDGLVEAVSEGVGCIDDEADVAGTAEGLHGFGIERSVDASAMLQREVLLARLRAVKIGRACLFEHFCGLAAFRGSAEYQYHDALLSSP